MPIKISFTNRQIKSLIIALIVLFTGGAGYVSNTSKSASQNYKKPIPAIEVDKQYEVTKVADGDTFSIKVADQIVKVRMIGADTPETVDPRKTVQCFGKQASDKTKELLIKRSVRLETDPTQGISDKYGRLLAYVYRDDGMFINAYLIEQGFAHEYTYNIPYQKQTEFKDLQMKAREERRGLWGDLCN